MRHFRLLVGLAEQFRRLVLQFRRGRRSKGNRILNRAVSL